MESGTHDFLMTKNCLYSNLLNAQMKQENDQHNEEDSLESDEEMDTSTITSRTKRRQITIEVK